MERKLSNQTIESFVGDVFPLRLLGGEAFGNEEITWRLEGDDCVEMRDFSPSVPRKGHYDTDPFTDGVLLSSYAPGNATVVAAFDGMEYTCKIQIRARDEITSDEATEFYLADMHVHTSNACSKPNGRMVLTTRSDGSSIAHYYQQIIDENKLDISVTTDHACFLNRKEFYRGFTDAEDMCKEDSPIIFAGAESELVVGERDRFGIPHTNSGEIVTINADQYYCCRSWQEFIEYFSNCPNVIMTLAHPEFFSVRSRGKGSFSLHRNNNARFRKMLRFVEMGDGSDRGGNPVHEHAFTMALDNGFQVSTTCSSDSHGPIWGYERIPGQTIVMAKEKSREAFVEALLNCRAYASSTGNVKVRYTVNGKAAPTKLSWCNKYDFHLEISYFYDDPTTEIVRGEVISDGGRKILDLEGDFSNMDFTIESKTASWFYLRLWDEEGRKTWSVPIWTAKEPYFVETAAFEPISKEGFTAIEETTGADASVLLCDDPLKPFVTDGKTCSILIDMKEMKNIRGLGIYPRTILGEHLKAVGFAHPKQALAQNPYHIVISTSEDGETFRKKADAVFRSNSLEEIIPFDRTEARYIRLEVLSTVGAESHRKEFEDLGIALGELTPFTRAEKEDIRKYYDGRMEELENPYLNFVKE